MGQKGKIYWISLCIQHMIILSIIKKGPFLMPNQWVMFYIENKQLIETLHILHVIKIHFSHSSYFVSLGTWSVLRWQWRRTNVQQHILCGFWVSLRLWCFRQRLPIRPFCGGSYWPWKEVNLPCHTQGRIQWWCSQL